ncbi:MAG: SHOCT domain-containing protein [Rhodospirillaceae bacterium]
MKGKENKHINAFRQKKLETGETVKGHLEGWIGELMGKGEKVQHNGQFVLTSERVCFYRKGILGEVFETIPLSKVSSVETVSLLGYRVLRIHTAHDALEFKTFEAKPLFDAVRQRLEALRHGPREMSGASAPQGESLMDQLKKLGELHITGVLTDDEFSAKKAELLAKL